MVLIDFAHHRTLRGPWQPRMALRARAAGCALRMAIAGAAPV
jgi:hypothetical protein